MVVSLGASALEGKSQQTYPLGDHAQMAENDAPTVVSKNLLMLIRREDPRPEPSVNAWAVKHGLGQKTIQRILDGTDLSLSMMEKIAAALRAKGSPIQAWHLLLPDLDPMSPQENVTEGMPDEQAVQLLRYFCDLGPEERDVLLSEVRHRAERAIGARVLAEREDRRGGDSDRRDDPHPQLEKRGLVGDTRWLPGHPMRTGRQRRRSK